MSCYFCAPFSFSEVHSDLLDLRWMGGNEPLRGLTWWERGVSTAMKYGARWTGPFIMLKGHTGEGAPREKSWEELEYGQENVWTRVSALLHRGFSGRARCTFSTHGAAYVCVYVAMCQVCASRKVAGKWEKEGEIEKRRGCEHSSWRSWWHSCMHACVSEVVRLTSSSPEDAGAARGWRCAAST